MESSQTYVFWGMSHDNLRVANLFRCEELDLEVEV